MAEPKTLKLQEPVKQGSEEIFELTIRPPKAKDLRKLPERPATGDLLDLAARITGQPPSVIDELGMADTMALLDIVGDFMEPGQKTGSNP